MAYSPYVIDWPSIDSSIKRFTCVNKQNSGSWWTMNNNITRAQTVWVSWRQDANGVRTSSRQRAWALSDPRLSNPAKMRKKYCWVQNNSPSLSQLISHTQQPSTFLKIKCERLYFYKEACSFVHWSSYIIGWLFLHIFVFVLWLYNTYTQGLE